MVAWDEQKAQTYNLTQPEGTAAVRHQCMNACKVSTCVSILINVLMENN